MPLTGRLEVSDGGVVANTKVTTFESAAAAFCSHNAVFARQVSLNAGEYQTMAAADGSFLFHNVPSGACD